MVHHGGLFEGKTIHPLALIVPSCSLWVAGGRVGGGKKSLGPGPPDVSFRGPGRVVAS